LKVPNKEGDIFEIVQEEIYKYEHQNKGQKPDYIELTEEQYKKCLSHQEYSIMFGRVYPPRAIHGIPIRRTDHTEQSTDYLKYVGLSENKDLESYGLSFQFGTFGAGIFVKKGDNPQHVIELLNLLTEEFKHQVKRQEG
jgi:hypothetical protein